MRDFWNRRSRRGKILLVVVALLVLFAVIGAFSGGGETDDAAPEAAEPAETTAAEAPAQDAPTKEASTCMEVPADLVAGIAEGLTAQGGGSLRFARAVKSDDPEGYLISADIQAPGIEGPDDIATWAREGSDINSGLLFAVDAVAREFSTWGAAAQEGSPAAELRDALAATPAYAQSRDCVADAG